MPCRASVAPSSQCTSRRSRPSASTTVRGVMVARSPLEQPVKLVAAVAQVIAVRDRLEAAPERARLERHRRDRRIVAQQVQHGLHVQRAVELVAVHLPQIVARGTRGVGLRHLVFFAGPEAVARDDLDFVAGIFLGLEAAQRLQRAVERVAVRGGNACRRRSCALYDDDLVGERIQRAQVVTHERLAVEHDHAKRDARPVAHAWARSATTRIW